MTFAIDDGFPAFDWEAGRPLWRIVRAVHGDRPYWFSCDGLGRFDPVGAGAGCCCFAQEPLGAWIETFRTAIVVDTADVDARRLAELRLDRRLRLADLTDRDALRHGVTAAVMTSDDYGASQRLAAQLLAAGFAGVRWTLRHDPSQRLCGIGLFGDGGARRFDPPHGSGTLTPIPEAVVTAAGSAFGYRVLPAP